MSTFIYDKTDKARTEIAHRSNQLSSRLRMLLVMVDGKVTAAELMRKVSGLGLDAHSLATLENEGYIVRIATVELPVAETSAGKVAEPEESAEAEAFEEAAEEEEAEEETEDDAQQMAEPAASAADTSASAEVARKQTIHHVYSEIIRESLGLRGVTMQLKVERASTLEDYRALAQPLIDAVKKSKGDEAAAAARKRIQAAFQ